MANLQTAPHPLLKALATRLAKLLPQRCGVQALEEVAALQVVVGVEQHCYQLGGVLKFQLSPQAVHKARVTK